MSFPAHYDDCTTFILTDPYGTVYGSFADNAAAERAKELLISEGFECWVQAVDHPAWD